MPETPETTPAFEPECWCDSAPCECPGAPKTPEAAPVPQHLGHGYDAVFAYIAELNDRWPDVTRNAAIWRAIQAFKDATLPAHEATVRRAYHAELFGTPEEIRQREIDAKANAKPDDIAELCERARPGHHEQRVRAKVAEELRADADAHRRLIARKPSQHDEARLARARTLDGAAARVARGEQP